MSNMETQFKIGDKVRFRQNGEIGEHNELFNVNFERDYLIDSIHSNGNTFVLTLDGNKTCIVSRLQIEPVPEPQPKFANIKVGDWVELNCYNSHQGKVKEKFSSGIGELCGVRIHRINPSFTITGLSGEFYYDSITRILSPKEVIMDFSSGVKGTIEKASDYAYFLVWHSKNDCDYSMIKLAALDHKTRAKVESIINAQEEECHN